MTLKTTLKSNYGGCICSHCSDKGVSVSLDKISIDHIIISGEQYKIINRYNDNLCNFFIFDHVDENPVQVAVIDMKGGKINEKEFLTAFQQLNNGASVTDSIIGAVDVDSFIPRLAIRKGVNSFASRMMASDKYKVVFRTFSENIRTIHNGQSLRF